MGSEYRKNDYRYIFDFLNTQDSFLDLGLGTFPANSTSGTTSVTEYYGELSVPIIKDVPGIEHLNLELGYRWSDYKMAGRYLHLQGARGLGHHPRAALPRRLSEGDARAEHR